MNMEQTLFDKNLNRVIDLCYEMLEVADYGDKHRNDAGCGVVYGTLRDVAYKLRSLAEKELVLHGSDIAKSSKDSKKD